MIESLLLLDIEILRSARELVGPEYALVIQLLGESIVFACSLFLLVIWFYGRQKNDNAYKIRALQIFFTIILPFLFYTIVNFGIPAWRPNPQEVVDGM
jgi:hypothetical protein